METFENGLQTRSEVSSPSGRSVDTDVWCKRGLTHSGRKIEIWQIKNYVSNFFSVYKITGSRERKEGQDQPGVCSWREGAGLPGGVLHQRKTVHILPQVRVCLYGWDSGCWLG